QADKDVGSGRFRQVVVLSRLKVGRLKRVTIKSLSPKRQEICLVGEHPCGAPAFILPPGHRAVLRWEGRKGPPLLTLPLVLGHVVPRVLPREGRKGPPLQGEPSD